MTPLSWFAVKSIVCSAERLVIDGGIIPVNLFLYIFMVFRFDKPPSQAGISPVSKFRSRSMLSRLVQFFRSALTSLSSELLAKLRCCSRNKRPIDEGISPWKLFWLRSSIFRNVRFPIDGVIVRASPSKVRLSTVTLLMLEAATDT